MARQPRERDGRPVSRKLDNAFLRDVMWAVENKRVRTTILPRLGIVRIDARNHLQLQASLWFHASSVTAVAYRHRFKESAQQVLITADQPIGLIGKLMDFRAKRNHEDV